MAARGVAAPSAVAISAVRDAIGLPLVVIFDDGSAVELPPDPVLGVLSGARSNTFAIAAQRIAVLRSDVIAAERSPRFDRALLRERLARAYTGITARPGWTQRLGRTLASFIRRVVSRLTAFRGVGSVLAWIVVAALLAGGVWALWRVLVPERRVRARPPGEPEPVDWKRLSAQAASRGDMTEAVRAQYRLLLETLEAKGILLNSPSLTAGECRTAVGRVRPGLLHTVQQATGVFERIAYGEHDLLPEDLDVMRRAESEIRAR